MNDKTRTRSKEELDSREKGFLEIVEIFEKNNINFFLQAGIVLGAYREKYFIKWDWDVEFGLFEKDFTRNYDLIRNELTKKDFKIFHEINEGKDGKLDCYKGYDHKSTLFEILSWRYDALNKTYHRWNINIPSRFLDTKYEINFLNRKFTCPGPIEEYLEYQYGDWKIPKVSDKKEDYLTKKFYKKSESKNLLMKLSKFLKRV